MKNQMDERYFEEKKELSYKELNYAIEQIQDSAALVESMTYTIPGILDSTKVHEILESAVSAIQNARRDFEKASWASTSTKLEFNEWLRKRNLSELVLGR